MNVYRVTLTGTYDKKWATTSLVSAMTAAEAIKKACFDSTGLSYETVGCRAKAVEEIGQLVQ